MRFTHDQSCASSTRVGVDRAFADILKLAVGCKYRDCMHSGEPDCGVEKAVIAGELASERVENYRRLQREIELTSHRSDARSSGNIKRRWKEISKSSRQAYRLREEKGK